MACAWRRRPWCLKMRGFIDAGIYSTASRPIASCSNVSSIPHPTCSVDSYSLHNGFKRSGVVIDQASSDVCHDRAITKQHISLSFDPQHYLRDIILSLVDSTESICASLISSLDLARQDPRPHRNKKPFNTSPPTKHHGSAVACLTILIAFMLHLIPIIR